MTTAEVSAVLQKHPVTVLGMARRGVLPTVRLGTRSVRFRPEDITRYIDEHRIGGDAP